MQNAKSPIVPNDIDKYVTHHYANNNGVRIHFVTIGEGPKSIVMLHGFPDFWYTWRNQMTALIPNYQVAAIDLGYNLSDKPQGGEYYQMRHLISDIQAVMHYLEKDKSIILGHDWGGVIAWFFGMYFPTMTERLIVLNTPHPSGIVRELAQNTQQQKHSAYARNFQQEGAHKQLTSESLSAWVHDPVVRERYIEAFRRSDFEAMLQYYKQNYPRQPYQNASFLVNKVQAPVLQIHGLQDPYLLPSGLNNTWDWLQNSWTLLTIPQAGHFVQHDATDLVNRTIVNWLTYY